MNRHCVVCCMEMLYNPPRRSWTLICRGRTLIWRGPDLLTNPYGLVRAQSACFHGASGQSVGFFLSITRRRHDWMDQPHDGCHGDMPREVKVTDCRTILEYHTQTLHVCHICLHWGGLRGQCRHIWHTWSVWDIYAQTLHVMSYMTAPERPPRLNHHPIGRTSSHGVGVGWSTHPRRKAPNPFSRGRSFLIGTGRGSGPSAPNPYGPMVW